MMKGFKQNLQIKHIFGLVVTNLSNMNLSYLILQKLRKIYWNLCKKIQKKIIKNNKNRK